MSIQNIQEIKNNKKFYQLKKTSSTSYLVYSYNEEILYILKNSNNEFNNIYMYNENLYYSLTNIILKKLGIKNNIPNRILLEPPILIENKEEEIVIDNYSCLIDYLGKHSRVTMNNEKQNKSVFPGWLYFIDVWLGRLDCYGDSNLIYTKEKKIIPIDFDLICTWAQSNHPWFINYTQFNFIHFEKIKSKKNYKIINAINEIKDEELWEILISSDINNKIIPLEIKEKYLEGLIYRKNNLIIN
jgi:hypothetical protein